MEKYLVIIILVNGIHIIREICLYKILTYTSTVTVSDFRKAPEPWFTAVTSVSSYPWFTRTLSGNHVTSVTERTERVTLTYTCKYNIIYKYMYRSEVTLVLKIERCCDNHVVHQRQVKQIIHV